MAPRKLNILACAYACDPAGGSERFVGWAAVRSLARRHRLTVITHGWGRKIIEEEVGNFSERGNLRFHYIGGRHRWHPNRLVARFQDWLRLHRWTARAHQLAQQLATQEEFDLAHHLTIATWRAPSPLGGLGLPLVWGPVGGGECFPLSFCSILSPAAQAFELLRWIGNQRTLHSPRMRRFVRQVSVALGNNAETLAALRRLGLPPGHVRYLSQSFLGKEKFLPRQKSSIRTTESSPKALRLFAGGNLEGRKGVAIALQALSLFGRRGHPFTFIFGGLGPELKHLQRRADKLDFGAGQVWLGRHFDSEQYRTALAEAQVYLLPSLREGAPVTMIEAMAAGCVPIVAGVGGAPMVVDERCGFVIPVTTPEKMVTDICNVLEKLAGDATLLDRLSESARQRVRDRCMEDTYLAGIEEAYLTALRSR